LASGRSITFSACNRDNEHPTSGKPHEHLNSSHKLRAGCLNTMKLPTELLLLISLLLPPATTAPTHLDRRSATFPLPRLLKLRIILIPKQMVSRIDVQLALRRALRFRRITTPHAELPLAIDATSIYRCDGAHRHTNMVNARLSTRLVVEQKNYALGYRPRLHD
jgi:hypothetical protein